MSNLGRTTILKVKDNICILEYEQYMNAPESRLNIEVHQNQDIAKATVFALLQELGIYFGQFKYKGEKEIAFAYMNGKKEKGFNTSAYYSIPESEEAISKVDFMKWEVIQADLTNEEVKREYEEYLEYNSEEESRMLLQKMFFVAEIEFKQNYWLNGLEEGMSDSSTLDTFICDWL